MRKYRMPFEYWDDEHTKLLKKKQPDVVDPDVYLDRLLWDCPGGPFMLNNRNRQRFKKFGPFKPPYYPASLIEDRYKGMDAFIFGPGPSMRDTKISAYQDSLTIAMNSAGFAFKPFFWSVFESNYMYWLREQRTIAPGHVFLMTARCALIWIQAGRTPRMRAAFIPRWEEERVVPPRTPAVCLTGSLVGAWQMGCKRAFLIGVDLSKPGQAYAEGVPHTEFGAKNPFDDQVRAIKQFKLPDFEVFYGSPHARRLQLPFTYMPYSEIEEIARASEKPEYPSQLLKKAKV